MDDDSLFAYAGLTREAVEWLVPGLVPRGMLTVLAGQQGLGKSLLYCAWAAGLAHHATASILVNAEDSPTHSTKPRLEALGAHDELIFGTRVHPSLGNGQSDRWYMEIGEWIVAKKAAMLVLDPLAAFIDGQADVYRDHHVRRILEPLDFIAHETNCAIVYVKHERKDATGEPLSRISDSVAFSAAARSVVMMKRDGEYSSRLRLVIHAKCNVAELAPIERWEVVPTLLDDGKGPTVRTARLESRGVAEGVTVWDAFAPPLDPEERTTIDEAKGIILAQLTDGEKASRDLERSVTESGISRATYDRARRELGVRATKRGKTWYSHVAMSQSKDLTGRTSEEDEALDSPVNHAEEFPF